MVKDYASAGVNIDVEGSAVQEVVREISKSLKNKKKALGENLTELGHFCSLVRIDSEKALAIATDGVGSKDLVAMNVNDIICSGATPLTLVDYMAFEKVDPSIAKEIGKGLARGAEQAGISVSGGEIATLPDIIKGVDLAGTAVGIVKVQSIVTGEKIVEGDLVIGLESSGVHSNGLTLARKVLLKHHGLDERIFGGKTVGEELLEPTKIYVREISDVIEALAVHGLANITGGGLGNLTRITNLGFSIDDLPEPQAVFKKIQTLEGISDKEMYRTFNMGVGFCVIVDEKQSDEVIDICSQHGTVAKIIGRAVKKPGVHIKDFKLTY
jgi:phosphoribosylformylglycinamidine cyclo-ligase